MSKQDKLAEPVAGDARTHEGITYRYVPSLGAWFGQDLGAAYKGKPVLIQLPASAATGEPFYDEGCVVVNVDEDQSVVDRINAALGTDYALTDFFGR